MFLNGIEGTIVDRREGNVQWKIPDCKTMHTMRKNNCYTSPPIHFLRGSWFLKFYPNGDENNAGYFIVHLVRIRSTQTTIPLTLNISLSLSLDEMDDASQIKCQMKTATHAFTENDYIYVWRNVFESILVWTNTPNSSAVTISLFATEGSLPISNFCPPMHRKTQPSSDFRQNYDFLHNDTDVAFIFKGRTYKAHKLILGIRSTEFNTLFEENRNIQNFLVENCDPDAFNMLLQFVYTGTLDELPLEKIKNLYEAAAVWYKDLARICASHMESLISEDTYKGIRDLAAKHNDELLLKATAKFQENKMQCMLPTYG